MGFPVSSSRRIPSILPSILGPLSVAILLLVLTGCGERALKVSGGSSSGLVFVVASNSGNLDISRARLSDGAVLPVTRTADRNETWPTWSQLARYLVYEVRTSDKQRTNDLMLWTPNTGEETPLTQTDYRSEGWAIWSPNRARLAFAFIGGATSGSGIAIVDPRAGAGAHLFVRGQGNEYFLRPTFSPNGELLVAQRRGRGGRGSNLWVLDGNNQRTRITNDPAWFDYKAWFTRSGDEVLYSRRPVSGGWHEIVAVGSDGSDLRVLCKGEETDYHSARPSPTRDEFALVSNRDETFDVYIANPDGKQLVNLSNTDDRHEFAPRWSPDGHFVAVTVAGEIDGTPLLQTPEQIAKARIVVYDRRGKVHLDVPGLMPDWMPAW